MFMVINKNIFIYLIHSNIHLGTLRFTYVHTYIYMYIQTNISTIIFKYNKFLLNINGGRKFVNK